MTPDHPYLSVIVPVKNGHNVLPRMLDMLSRSELPRETWELIVVDDGSSDDSVAIASAYADQASEESDQARVVHEVRGCAGSSRFASRVATLSPTKNAMPTMRPNIGIGSGRFTPKTVCTRSFR